MGKQTNFVGLKIEKTTDLALTRAETVTGKTRSELVRSCVLVGLPRVVAASLKEKEALKLDAR